MNFMPIFDLRFLKQFDSEKFDIFDTSLLDPDIDLATVNLWDYFLPIDYDKLKRLIKLQVNIRLMEN